MEIAAKCLEFDAMAKSVLQSQPIFFWSRARCTHITVNGSARGVHIPKSMGFVLPAVAYKLWGSDDTNTDAWHIVSGPNQFDVVKGTLGDKSFVGLDRAHEQERQHKDCQPHEGMQPL